MKRRSLSFSELKGQLWATGKTPERPEDPLKSAEESMGREWFAVTAFPLFAGTFGSIATALNVCAIVQPWRSASIPGEVGSTDIPDPPWLIAVNALSLAFGVIANLSISLIMPEPLTPISRYRFHAVNLVIINIITGLLASFILMALIIITALDLRIPPSSERIFTEAYFYAIMAAVLYFITSSFIIYTAYLLLNSHRPRDILKSFGRGHRSLKLLTMLFMSYVLIGAAIFSKIEGWRYMDGVFWTDVTLLTVGFGDFKPVTHLGRCLLFPYATFGILILCMVIYCTTQVVFERGKSMWEVRLRDQERIRKVRKRDKARKNPVTPTPQKSDEVIAEGSNDVGPQERKISFQERPPLKDPKTARRKRERDARRRDFEAMQKILVETARKRILYSMFLWIISTITLWLVGAAFFYLSERAQGWTYFNSVYFTFISILAIGYGDVTLQSMAGKSFFVLWSLIVVPTLTMLIATATEAVGIPYLTGAKQWVRRRFRKKQPPKINRHLSTSLIPMEDLPHNSHDKNHLLVQAIKKITLDQIRNQQNNKKPDYSFEDWEYIFYLMGVLEPSGEENPASTEEDHELGGSKRSGLDQWQDGGQMVDWLHGKNPLNVSETLTEWMLLSLVDKLEEELLELRKQNGNTAVE